VPAPNAEFTAIAAGAGHGLGLKADGTIVAWGDNAYGQCAVPAPNAGFVALSAGYYGSAGLKADGSIVAWGWNGYGQCDVPAPNADFVAVAAGYAHVMGLKSEGSIVTWGANYNEQLDVPPPNAGFVAIGAGADHSLAIRADGALCAWGEAYGGTNDVPAPNAGFELATASEYSCLAIRRPDGDTAVFLSMLTIEAATGEVRLYWEHAETGLPVAFRLEASQGEQEWLPACVPVGPCSYEATDRSLGVAAGGAIDYALWGREGDEPWQLLRQETVSVEPVRTRTALLGAFPNPFNPQTSIRFTLAVPGTARVAIYDLAGRRVITLAEQRFAAGPQELIWQGSDEQGRAVSSGVYLCRLETFGLAESRKLVLLR
jgi:hypothetical protein